MNTQKVFSCCFMCLLLSVVVIGTAQDKGRRNLGGYMDGGYYELSYIARHKEEFEEIKERVRQFIWTQWQRKHTAHITVKDCAMYPEGCHDSTTYNFYIEPGSNGSWQITEESDHYVSALENGGKEESRRYTVTYSNVEKSEVGAECPSLLSDSYGQSPKGIRLRLTMSQPNKDRSSRPCVLL